jgi:uncharacterized phiE125 gp8 family phage protein
MPISVATAATFEPVSLAEARAHLRLDQTTEDAYVELLIAAARERVEQDTHRKLCTQTLDYFCNHFPCSGVLEIPTAPVSAITSVNYTVEGVAETAFSSTYYNTDIVSEPARIVLTTSASWPTGTLKTVNAVRVRFVAGYADGSCPQALRAAMLLLIGHLFENREAVTLGQTAVINSKPLEMGYAALVNPWRLPSGWGI